MPCTSPERSRCGTSLGKCHLRWESNSKIWHEHDEFRKAFPAKVHMYVLITSFYVLCVQGKIIYNIHLIVSEK